MVQTGRSALGQRLVSRIMDIGDFRCLGREGGGEMQRDPNMDKTFTYAGVALSVVGVSVIVMAGIPIYATYQACLGGNSPQPDQGCGYILNPAFWQDTPSVVALATVGPIVLLVGILCLVIARHISSLRKRSFEQAPNA